MSRKSSLVGAPQRTPTASLILPDVTWQTLLHRRLATAMLLAAASSCGGDAPTDPKTTIRRVVVTSPKPLADSTGASTPIVGGIVGGLGLATGDSQVMAVFPIDTTSLYLAMSPGTVEISVNLGLRATLLPITVDVNPRDICVRAVGSILLSGDASPIFLGDVSAPTDPLSIFNPTGVDGSTTGSLSVNNQNGRYGVVYSDYSARNPYAANPPVMSKNSVASYCVTLRSNEILGTTPQYLAVSALP